MNDSDIRKLVQEGETSDVEFKTRIVHPQILSRNISAFANTSGGTILVGVDERHGIVGCDVQQLRRAFESSQRNISDAVDLSLEFVQVDGKDVGVISVSKATGIVSSREGVFVRRGAAVLVMTAQEMQKRLSSEESPVDRLTVMVAEQTKRIEELLEDIRKGGSWQSKAVDYFLGGLVGAIIGFVLTLALT